MNFIWNIPKIRENNDDLPNIVLAHGFGANNRDLENIRFEVDVRARWYFPQASVQIQNDSYAWFPSDPQELEKTLNGDYFQHLANISVPELSTRAEELSHDARELGIDWKNSYIGGYSQGSIMAFFTMLEQRLPVKGLILLSSTLMDRQSVNNLMSLCKPTPVFQSHGSLDQVIPIQGAQELRTVLSSAGWNVDFHVFQGGHEIPIEILLKLKNFLSDQHR